MVNATLEICSDGLIEILTMEKTNIPHSCKKYVENLGNALFSASYNTVPLKGDAVLCLLIVRLRALKLVFIYLYSHWHRLGPQVLHCLWHL
jgi:hypothetical protein